MKRTKITRITFMAAIIMVLFLVPGVHAVLLDSYDSDKDYWREVWGEVGQCINLAQATKISSVDFYLKRDSSATGQLRACLAPVESGTVGVDADPTGGCSPDAWLNDITTISTSGAWYTFNFPPEYKAAGDWCVKIQFNWIVDRGVYQAWDSASPTHAGNAAIGAAGYSWADANFYLYGTTCTCTPGATRCNGNTREECSSDCVSWTDIGCCQHSKCAASQYCSASYACTALSTCYERTGTDTGQDPQESNEDLRDECGTSSCYTGNCNGAGACGIYSAGQKGSCGTCYYCNDADAACDLVGSGSDPTGDCAVGSWSCDGNCRLQRNSGNCNGAGACLTNDEKSNCASGYACSAGSCGSANYCDGTDHCSGNTRYTGYTCNGANTCNVDKGDIGCCQHSKCSASQYCSAGYACTALSLCGERTGTDTGQDPQESNEDLRSECGTTDCYTGNCAGGSYACGIYSGGEEGSCAACYGCSDADSACDPIADNTQDNTGSNTCAATCKTCNGVGSCVNQDADEDLFSQCGAIECDAGAGTPYYDGWASLTCYYKADVSAANANCDGAGACKTAADYCPSQAQDGSTGVTCECTDAQTGCSSTTAGSCNNNLCSTCNYGGSGNWHVNAFDNCTITSNVNMGGNNIIFNSSGIFKVNADITNYGKIVLSDGSKIVIATSYKFG